MASLDTEMMAAEYKLPGDGMVEEVPVCLRSTGGGRVLAPGPPDDATPLPAQGISGKHQEMLAAQLAGIDQEHLLEGLVDCTGTGLVDGFEWEGGEDAGIPSLDAEPDGGMSGSRRTTKRAPKVLGNLGQAMEFV
jgi:hypothetical protein